MTPAALRQLRQQVRSLRAALSLSQRTQAAQQMTAHVAALEVFANTQHIAGYLATNGEMDPATLLKQALASGKTIYLPVLQKRDEPMLFAPYQSDTALKPNRFGIFEPDVPQEALRSARCLELVLTPLVAFDKNGNRLGMGGGYYDRTFAFLLTSGASNNPYLLGLAYEMQKVSTLPRQPWDIPLAGVVTETSLYPGTNNWLLK